MWLLACQFHLVHSFTYSTDDYGDTAAFWTLYSVLVILGEDSLLEGVETRDVFMVVADLFAELVRHVRPRAVDDLLRELFERHRRRQIDGVLLRTQRYPEAGDPDIGHYRVLSRVPCAIQYVLINYLF